MNIERETPDTQEVTVLEKPLPLVLRSEYRTFTVAQGSQVVFIGNFGVIRKNNVDATVALELLLDGPSQNGLLLSRGYASPSGELTSYVAGTVWLEPGNYRQTLRWVADTATNIDGGDLYLKPEEQLSAGVSVTRQLRASGKGGNLYMLISGQNNREFRGDILCVFEGNNRTANAYVREELYLAVLGIPPTYQTENKKGEGLVQAILDKKDHLLKNFNGVAIQPPMTLIARPVNSTNSDAHKHELTVTVRLTT